MYKPTLHTIIQETINVIVAQLVYLNLTLKEADIELFEHSPEAFINNKIEEGIQETRRRNSLNLLRQLSFNFDIIPSLSNLQNGRSK